MINKDVKLIEQFYLSGEPVDENDLKDKIKDKKIY